MKKVLLVMVASLVMGGIGFAKKNIFAAPPVVVKKVEKKVVSSNPLQRYALEAYKVTGIVVVEGGWKKAIVITPDKKTFFIGVGDYLGNRGERVIDIRNDALILKREGKIIVFPIKEKKL